MKDNMTEITIEQTFRAKPWLGFISLEEAIADAIAYRSGLSVEDRHNIVMRGLDSKAHAEVYLNRYLVFISLSVE